MAERIIERIERRRAAVGLSKKAMYDAAGIGPDVLRDATRYGSLPRIDTLQALAGALDTSLGYLLGLDAAPAPRPNAPSSGGVRVRGEVAAGLWLETAAVDDAGLGVIPLGPDPRYEASAQYALLVRGTSINRVAAPGDYVVCRDIRETGSEPADGDLVIVERRRGGGSRSHRQALQAARPAYHRACPR